MKLRNSAERYGLVAIVLHWAIAVLAFGQIGLGLTMMRVESQRLAFDLIQWHKSTGFLIFGLWTILKSIPLRIALLPVLALIFLSTG